MLFTRPDSTKLLILSFNLYLEDFSFYLMFQFPKFVFDCLVLSVCSAAGQLFIYYTIATFGPVVFVIIMTIRQVNNLKFCYRNVCAVQIECCNVHMPNHLAIWYVETET
jgi:hypothetical protein